MPEASKGQTQSLREWSKERLAGREDGSPTVASDPSCSLCLVRGLESLGGRCVLVGALLGRPGSLAVYGKGASALLFLDSGPSASDKFQLVMSVL